ncbi:MAG: transcriptional regulator protein-like protein [Marmoricola sp.]|nr:transcriptional regulator protein-like protein [Marmoricola sp.]
MSAPKSERLLNLVILLLVSRNYVTKDRIREVIEPYQGSSDEAFEKMFERDKEELRGLGIPIEVGFLDKFFEDEQGYRIKRDAFELPAIDLQPDEVAVLGLAARVWQHAGLASATSQALVKLKAAGFDVDREALDAVQPRLVAQEPAFDAMWDATLTRTPVTFDYRRPADTTTKERTLQPWGIVTSRERWYVVGFDTDRGETRMFRLSRVEGEVRTAGAPGSFAVPPGTDVRAISDSLAPVRPSKTATVLARKGAVHGLRRRASVVAEQVDGPDQTGGWDRLTVPYAETHAFVGEVLGYADAVVVEEPADLRTDVIASLRSISEGAA